MIKKAIEFAKEKHKGQKYNGKDFFFNHPAIVAKILQIITTDKNLICAAYLHDSVEDTQTTFNELAEEFNQDIADLVREVTKTSYNTYPVKSVKGVLLKFADRLANIASMGSWDAMRQYRYIQKSKFWK